VDLDGVIFVRCGGHMFLLFGLPALGISGAIGYEIGGYQPT
jgi:hypothetical protein